VRVLLALLLLPAPLLLAQGKPGALADLELPPAGKKDPPILYSVYRATTAKGDGPFPLIFALHAGTGTAHQIAGVLRPMAEGQGAILVGAQGFREIVGADGFWWKGDAEEQGMLDRLLDHVRKTLPVQPKFTVVGFADGAELGIKWAVEKDRGVRGMIAVNFVWKPPAAAKAPKDLKFCLFASRDGKEKLLSLREEAQKAQKAFTGAKYPVVLRIVPGAGRSLFDGWENEFGKACRWFDGALDWPAELAKAAPAEPPDK
jgi:pimeloyl-ACP methyl ester carboxylesterase